MSFRPNKPPPPGVNPQYSSFSYPAGGFTPPSQPEAPRRDARQPGVPGGSWGETSSMDSMQLYSAPRRPGPPISQPSNPMPAAQPVKRPAEQPRPHLMVAAEPGAYERALIDDLTQPGGARPKPPDKDLAEFSNKCKFLDTEVVARLLFERLGEPTRGLVTVQAESVVFTGATGKRLPHVPRHHQDKLGHDTAGRRAEWQSC